MDNLTPEFINESRKLTQDITQRLIEEASKKRCEFMESYVIAYLQKTGYAIEEVELVERYDGPRIIWYLRKKGSDD